LRNIFIPFPLPLTKSALRITEVKSLEKNNCLRAAISHKIMSYTSIFYGSQELDFLVSSLILDFQGSLADFSQG